MNEELKNLFDRLLDTGLTEDQYIILTTALDNLGVDYDVTNVRVYDGIVRKYNIIFDGYEGD